MDNDKRIVFPASNRDDAPALVAVEKLRAQATALLNAQAVGLTIWEAGEIASAVRNVSNRLGRVLAK